MSEKYTRLLSERDREEFYRLKNFFINELSGPKKNKKVEIFNTILNKIKNFSIHNDSDDWKRSIVCGILWVDDESMIVSNKILTNVINQSKSAINYSFQMMNFTSCPIDRITHSKILKMFPFLDGDSEFLKHLTLRQRKDNNLTIHNDNPKKKADSSKNIDSTDNLCNFQNEKVVEIPALEIRNLDVDPISCCHSEGRCDCCDPVLGCTCSIQSLLNPVNVYPRPCRCGETDSDCRRKGKISCSKDDGWM